MVWTAVPPVPRRHGYHSLPNIFFALSDDFVHERILVVIILVICPATWAHDSENTVTDSLGRRVRVPVPVRRAVSLSASGVECIQIMGRMDTLVGVTEHTKTRIGQFPEIAGLPSVGRGFMPNLEVIAELRPDVVLAWKTNPGPELERQLEPLGIAVLRLDLTEPKTLPEEMRTLASILGTEAQARTEAYWEWVARWTAQIQKSIAGHPKPTVLAEHFTPLRIAGPGSGLYELTQMAGGNNLAGDIGIRSMQVDSEWVLERNPQLFVKSILWANKIRKRIPGVSTGGCTVSWSGTTGGCLTPSQRTVCMSSIRTSQAAPVMSSASPNLRHGFIPKPPFLPENGFMRNGTKCDRTILILELRLLALF